MSFGKIRDIEHIMEDLKRKKEEAGFY